jgi:hypothetical protein
MKLRVFYKERMQLKKGHLNALDPINANRLRGSTHGDNPDKPSDKPSAEGRESRDPTSKESHLHLGMDEPKHPRHSHADHEQDPGAAHPDERRRDSNDRDEGRDQRHDRQEGNLRRQATHQGVEGDGDRRRAERRDAEERGDHRDVRDREDHARKLEG